MIYKLILFCSILVIVNKANCQVFNEMGYLITIDWDPKHLLHDLNTSNIFINQDSLKNIISRVEPDFYYKLSLSGVILQLPHDELLSYSCCDHGNIYVGLNDYYRNPTDSLLGYYKVIDVHNSPGRKLFAQNNLDRYRIKIRKVHLSFCKCKPYYYEVPYSSQVKTMGYLKHIFDIELGEKKDFRKFRKWVKQSVKSNLGSITH